MRTRSRTIAHQTVNIPASTYSFYHMACDGTRTNGSDVNANLIFNPEETQETIKDELGRGRPHGCVHDKVYHHTSGDSAMYQYGAQLNGKNGVYTFALPNYLRYSNWLNHHYIVQTMNGSNGSLGRGWSIGNLSFSEESLKNDCIEGSRQLAADVLLNVVEANQIVPSIKSLATSLPIMAMKWKSIRRYIRQGADLSALRQLAASHLNPVTARKQLQAAAGGYLAWKFGISPILSDVMAIDRYMRTVSDKFRRHEQGLEHRVVRRADLPCTFMATAPGPTVLNGYDIWRFWHTGRVINSPVLRYVLVTKPIVPYRTELFKKLDFAMRRFATSPASLAWELVPFSFVVDWFVDVRSALNAIDKSLGQKPYEVISFTRSISYELSNSTRVRRLSPCDGSVIYDNEMGSTTVKHYERSLASSSGVMPHWKPRFGKNQAAISAALITQSLTKIR